MPLQLPASFRSTIKNLSPSSVTTARIPSSCQTTPLSTVPGPRTVALVLTANQYNDVVPPINPGTNSWTNLPNPGIHPIIPDSSTSAQIEAVTQTHMEAKHQMQECVPYASNYYRQSMKSTYNHYNNATATTKSVQSWTYSIYSSKLWNCNTTRSGQRWKNL